METVQQNGRFTLFSSKFLSIYSILYGKMAYLGREGGAPPPKKFMHKSFFMDADPSPPGLFLITPLEMVLCLYFNKQTC